MTRATAPLFVAALAVASLPSVHARAQASAASRPDVVDALRSLDQAIRAEHAGLAGPWGTSLDVEQKKLEGARRVRDDVRARLASLATTGEVELRARLVVEKNLGRLDRDLLRAERVHAVTEAEHAILAAHREGRAADDTMLKNLDDAVRALEKTGGDGFAALAREATTRSTRLKADRGVLVALAATRAAEAASRAALDDAMRAANRARRQIEAHLEDALEPVPAELLMAHQLATDQVVAKSADAGRFYVDEHRALALASAWREKSGDARDAAIASLLEATFIDSGVVKTPAMKASIPADAGWCYAVVMRFARDTGDEEVRDVKLKPAKGAAARFFVPHKGVGAQEFFGACVDDDTKIAVTAKVSRKGKNDLHYVVVGWQRADFPMSVARHMSVVMDDPCDTDAWLAAWTRPVPGAVVYQSDTPHLVLASERPTKDTVTLLSLTGERLFDVKKGALSSKAPAARKLDLAFSWKGCPSVEVAEHKDSVALAKCHEGVDKRFGAKERSALLALERATTDAAREKAERAIADVKERDLAERAKKCEPLEKKIEERARRAFERALDHHAEHGADAPFDRMRELTGELAADPDLR